MALNASLFLFGGLPLLLAKLAVWRQTVSSAVVTPAQTTALCGEWFRFLPGLHTIGVLDTGNYDDLGYGQSPGAS